MTIAGEVKLLGDAYPGCYANGLSMIGSDTMNRFQTKLENDRETLLQTEDGISLTVRHETRKKDGVRVIHTSITNGSDKDISMEMLTSFLLRDIKADKLHRMLSFWSEEGRHQVEELAELNMEVSWAKHGMRVLKYGNIGSMPVRGYFPFVALEDSESGHFVGVSLYSPSSWQIEVICHRNEFYTLAGGIADRDYGQWMKTLAPGENFTAPKAVVAEGNSLLEVCDLLVKEQTPDSSDTDKRMGITFNEYCTTWGDPTIENLKRIADKLEGKGIQYLVMDSGWYLEEGQYWWDYIGKWEANQTRFPKGLGELSDYVRSKGMIPGIWFEPESLAWGSDYYENLDYILTRDGYPLTVGGKRFLDMESPKVREFLRDKVIGLLKENHFGYVKIDYNDSIGMGCDGEESLGENLRRKVLASQDFFRELKEEIPELVIENCSSGGHRLEPSMMELCSMASFSDAHETLSIPLIAGNLQMMVAPAQNQIWAVLRKEDSDARIYYSLAATFLGRMGLSGDIYDLSEHQWKLVEEGITFYKKASDIIKHGTTTVLYQDAKSWNTPCGKQIVVREYQDKALVVVHRFQDWEETPFVFDVTRLIYGAEKETGTYGYSQILCEYGDLTQEYSAKAWILERNMW